MSSVRGEWVDPHGHLPARARLESTVHALARARRRQVFARYGWVGLCCGLVASTVAVLGIRLADQPVAVWTTAAALTTASLLVAFALAWRHRPDDLDVAIRADLRLNMKQRMSTAWELVRNGGDAELIERLATQAVRARLPSRSASVFAAPAGTWALLAPLAALVLALAGTMDLGWVAHRAPSAIDHGVVSEGVRLHAYGRRSEARARHLELPRTADASRRMQQLGAAMESGRLERAGALQRLRALGEDLDAERRAALGDGSETRIGPLDVAPLSESPLMRGGAARGMLERLLRGELDADEARTLGSDPGALSRLGIGGEDLERALESLARGDQRPLREMLERLERADRALDEARELARAREQVDRARAGLGESDARRDDGAARTDTATGADDATRGSQPEATGSLADGDEDGGGSGPGIGTSPDDSAARRAAEPAARHAPNGPALEARGEPRAGGVFVSEARVPPRVTAPTADTARLDPRFAAQVEAALAKDRFPPRHKESIRRYFLRLSAGAGEGGEDTEDEAR